MIDFEKYTANGNNFIVIDETRGCLVPEDKKADLARLMLDSDYGAGGDDVIYLQALSRELFQDIDSRHSYWGKIEKRDRESIRQSFEQSDDTFAFRLFEPDGSEAFVCGNGMRCAASYLRRTYGLRSLSFLTEIPTRQPRIKAVTFLDLGDATNDCEGVVEINMGQLMDTPIELMSQELREALEPSATNSFVMRPRVLRARHADDEAVANQLRAMLLVYTGEPYLVVVGDPAEHYIHLDARAFEDWALKFNPPLCNYFPFGINIVVGAIFGGNGTSFRVFERIKNRETGASGSGAVAIAAVLHDTGTADARHGIEVWPTRSGPTSAPKMGPILARLDGRGDWYQSGGVAQVYHGRFLFGVSLLAQTK